MKITKRMKKVFSLLLSAAMVVTGVNVTANTADSSESVWLTITAQEYNGSKNLTGKTQITGTGDYEIAVTGFSGTVGLGNLGFCDDWASNVGKLDAPDNVSAMKFDLTGVVVNGEYEMAVPASAAWAKDKNPFQQYQNGFPNQWNTMEITEVIVSNDDASLKFYNASASEKNVIGLFVGEATEATPITSLTYKINVTNIEFVSAETEPTQAPAAEITVQPDESAPSNTPAPKQNKEGDPEKYEGSDVGITVSTKVITPQITAQKKGKNLTITFKKAEGNGYQTQYQYIGRKKWYSMGNLKGKLQKRISRPLKARGFLLRMRTYTKVNGRKKYSAWSNVVAIK